MVWVFCMGWVLLNSYRHKINKETILNKTVLVTGGNKGIGLELTKKFLKLGYKIIIIARDFENFEFSQNEQIQMISFDLITDVTIKRKK